MAVSSRTDKLASCCSGLPAGAAFLAVMKNEHKMSSEGLFLCCRLKDLGSPVTKYCFIGVSDVHHYSSCPPSLTLTLTLKGNISVNRV